MERPAVMAPASAPTVVDGTAVRRRRAAIGLSQEQLARRSGVTQSLVSKIELGQVRLTPSTARQLARALEDARHAGILDGVHERCAEALAADKRERDLVDAEEIARHAEVSTTKVRRWAAAGDLEAHRYPGAWPGAHPPWLFRRSALSEAKRLAEAVRAGRSERMAQKWKDGTITKPHGGITRPCDCGCGRSVYRTARQLGDRQHAFYSRRCRQRHRWQTGFGLERLLDHYSGRVRRAWLNRWRGRVQLVEARHEKGKVAAVEAVEMAEMFVRTRTSLPSRRRVIDYLIEQLAGQSYLTTPEGLRRSAKDPEYRKARKRIERRLRSGTRHSGIDPLADLH